MKKMIRKHFSRELEKIKKQILSLGAKVEEQVRMATQAVEAHDAELAKQIIKSDFEIDEMEVEIEEECLKILALHQPVAVDLRFLVAVIKINNDLERIGDQAVNIAERVDVIAKRDLSEFFFDYTAMGEKVQDMLKMVVRLPDKSRLPSRWSLLWQRTQYLSKTGCTTASYSRIPLVSQSGTAGRTAGFRMARGREPVFGTVMFVRVSWHPTQLRRSPGIVCISEPIVINIFPSASSAWK